MGRWFMFAGIGAVAVVAAAGAAAVLLPGGPQAEAPHQTESQRASKQPKGANQPDASKQHEGAQQQAASQPSASSSPEAPGPAAQPKRRDFADWALICPRPGADSSCLVAQNHLQPESQRTIFAIQMRRADDDGVQAALITPLHVLLKHGLALEIGEAEPVRVAFNQCIGQQCQATIRLDKQTLASLLAAQTARASFAMATGQTFAVDLSLDGLDEALTALGLQPSRGDLLQRSN